MTNVVTWQYIFDKGNGEFRSTKIQKPAFLLRKPSWSTGKGVLSQCLEADGELKT